ncbi:MAG: DUF2971 domain-containing protein [Proteobacteria bacterium]|jgi:hypothetical protein|nr:DUF2971 domain-containing protein [Pseudomonadota bacterium]
MDLKEFDNHPDGCSGVTMFGNQYCLNGDEGIRKFFDQVNNAKSLHELPNPLFPLPQFDDKIAAVSGKLYHYTTADALLNIIKESKEKDSFDLHLSRIDYTNDTSEGGKIFSMVLKEFKDIIGDNELIYNFILPYFTDTQVTNREAFVCSFSTDKDSLPLWQGYANKGVGYNLAFDSKLLHTNGEVNNFFLVPVIYDCKLMCEITSCVLHKIYEFEFAKSFKNDSEEKEFEEMILEFCCLAQLAFKHPSFSYEHEGRIVILNSKSVEYKQQNGVIKPYTKLSLPKKLFTEITIGPLIEAEIAQLTIKNALASHGFECKVDISQAPVRFL